MEYDDFEAARIKINKERAEKGLPEITKEEYYDHDFGGKIEGFEFTNKQAFKTIIFIPLFALLILTTEYIPYLLKKKWIALSKN